MIRYAILGAAVLTGCATAPSGKKRGSYESTVCSTQERVQESVENHYVEIRSCFALYGDEEGPPNRVVAELELQSTGVKVNILHSPTGIDELSSCIEQKLLAMKLGAPCEGEVLKTEHTFIGRGAPIED